MKRAALLLAAIVGAAVAAVAYAARERKPRRIRGSWEPVEHPSRET